MSSTTPTSYLKAAVIDVKFNTINSANRFLLLPYADKFRTPKRVVSCLTLILTLQDTDFLLTGTYPGKTSASYGRICVGLPSGMFRLVVIEKSQPQRLTSGRDTAKQLTESHSGDGPRKLGRQ